MGRIGRAVAMLAKAFGMSIHTYDPRKKDNRNADVAVVHEHLEAFLSTADVLLLASPLNDETRYFLNAEKIRLMKRSAIVVNVGRGDLIKDDDVIDALRNQRIFAAGLDVFSNEPKVDARYFESPKCFHAAAHRKFKNRDPRDDGAGFGQRSSGFVRGAIADDRLA